MGKSVELLAPAGNYEAFLGAVNAGADAVYLGGERFGARAYAENFRAEEILRAIHVAHFYGKKIYLTVNTLLKEREISELEAYLSPFYEAGLDGVIVQDLGALRYIRESFPGLSLHASTQMTVTGVRGASLLKEAGISRIVPARELSLEEVRKIREMAGVEVECFIHGAMCYCYSGQCLFSSMLGGRSGNRGRCAQPCRLPYEVLEGKKSLTKEGYPLSLKDMCTLEYLPALLEAGIDSFKIEGRMKRPEYAAGVTAVYRKYIDRYNGEGASRYRVEGVDLDSLKSLYIRSEIQTGYYERHNGREMITLEKPGYEGSDEALLCKIRETYIRELPGMPVRMCVNIAAGEPLRIRIMQDAGDGDTSGKEKEEAAGKACGEEERTENIVAEATGGIVQTAKNAPLTKEDVRKHLVKTGESLLTVTECEISLEEGCFVPVRALNELRREAMAAFEDEVCARRMKAADAGTASAGYSRDMRETMREDRPSQSIKRRAAGTCHGQKPAPALHALVATAQQLSAAASCGCERLYIESDLFLRESNSVLSALRGMEKTEIYLALPYILRERDDAYLQRLADALGAPEAVGIRGGLVRNLEGLAYVRELCAAGGWQGKSFSLVADAGLYCFNKEAAAFLADYVDEITLPYELNAGEAACLAQKAREQGIAVNLIVYSHIPMMISANCLAKTADVCRLRENGNGSALSGDAGEKRIFLKDRKQVVFPVVLNCEHCYNVLYNAVPYSLHAAKKECERIDAPVFRYDFTTEPGEVCRQILNGTYVFTDYTAGHCKRGVE